MGHIQFLHYERAAVTTTPCMGDEVDVWMRRCKWYRRSICVHPFEEAKSEMNGWGGGHTMAAVIVVARAVLAPNLVPQSRSNERLFDPPIQTVTYEVCAKGIHITARLLWKEKHA